MALLSIILSVAYMRRDLMESLHVCCRCFRDGPVEGPGQVDGSWSDGAPSVSKAQCSFVIHT